MTTRGKKDKKITLADSSRIASQVYNIGATKGISDRDILDEIFGEIRRRLEHDDFGLEHDDFSPPKPDEPEPIGMLYAPVRRVSSGGVGHEPVSDGTL